MRILQEPSQKKIVITQSTDRSVFVLGGSRGIGAAVRRFASEGERVTFTYASSRQAAEQLAAETGSVALQTNNEGRHALRTRIAVGSIEALVANAGMLVAGDPVRMNPEDVDRLTMALPPDLRFQCIDMSRGCAFFSLRSGCLG